MARNIRKYHHEDVDLREVLPMNRVGHGQEFYKLRFILLRYVIMCMRWAKFHKDPRDSMNSPWQLIICPFPYKWI